jgi:hypothetical protein
MASTRRIIIGVIIIIAVVASILLIESYRRSGGGQHVGEKHSGPRVFSSGCIPVYCGKKEPHMFCQENSARLKKTGFVDEKENKPQEGWLLSDIILLYVKKNDLSPESIVSVSSSSRAKKVELTWKQVSNESNKIILAPTKQEALKLASSMKGLETRELWVQEVDRIEVIRR